MHSLRINLTRRCYVSGASLLGLCSSTLFVMLTLLTLFLSLFSPSNADDVAHSVHEPWGRSENNYFATCEKSMRISITACDQELTVPIQVNYLLHCAHSHTVVSGQRFSSSFFFLPPLTTCLLCLSSCRKNLLEIYE